MLFFEHLLAASYVPLHLQHLSFDYYPVKETNLLLELLQLIFVRLLFLTFSLFHFLYLLPERMST